MYDNVAALQMGQMPSSSLRHIGLCVTLLAHRFYVSLYKLHKFHNAINACTFTCSFLSFSSLPLSPSRLSSLSLSHSLGLYYLFRCIFVCFVRDNLSCRQNHDKNRWFVCDDSVRTFGARLVAFEPEVNVKMDVFQWESLTKCISSRLLLDHIVL